MWARLHEDPTGAGDNLRIRLAAAISTKFPVREFAKAPSPYSNFKEFRIATASAAEPWDSPASADTEVGYDDDLGGVRLEGVYLRRSSSTRQSSWCENEA